LKGELLLLLLVPCVVQCTVQRGSALLLGLLGRCQRRPEGGRGGAGRPRTALLGALLLLLLLQRSLLLLLLMMIPKQ
jgi:hypothetical protein